jgi:hypothetical protein
MPTFEKYVEVEVEAEMNISPKEFVQACDEADLEDLIRAINKYYKKGIPLGKSENLFDDQWNDMIKKLAHARLQMSTADIQTIQGIANKY